MVAPSFGFSIVFILLALLIMIYRKRGRPLDREEKQYFIIGLVIGIALSVIFGIFPILEYYNVPPPNLLPALIILLYILIIGLGIFVATKIFLHCKRRIERNIKEHYLKRLQKEIGLELEKEATTKNIALAPQEKDEVLELLTRRVCSDIMDGLLPNYDVFKVPYPPNSMKLVYIIFTISQDSAEILSKKMTELYNNQKYKRRLYRYSSLFM